MRYHKENKRKPRLIPVLAYHEVALELEAQKHVRSMHPSCCMHLDDFIVQLNYLASKNYKAVLFKDILETRRNVDNQKEYNMVVITFDDGHIGNFNFAYPHIHNRNWRAVFFVTVNYIGQVNMMDWDQLKEMSRSGMSVQSHCMTHDPLETLDKNKIHYELSKSKSIIEDRLGYEVDTVSLPHGSYNPDVVRIAKDCNYRFICTSKIGFLNQDDVASQVLIPRIGISSGYSITKFSHLIDPYSYVFKLNKLKSYLKLIVRKKIGIDFYRSIYRLVSRIEE